jgi:hypothetical protein
MANATTQRACRWWACKALQLHTNWDSRQYWPVNWRDPGQRELRDANGDIKSASSRHPIALRTVRRWSSTQKESRHPNRDSLVVIRKASVLCRLCILQTSIGNIWLSRCDRRCFACLARLLLLNVGLRTNC